jgi:hypothetical protein
MQNAVKDLIFDYNLTYYTFIRNDEDYNCGNTFEFYKLENIWMFNNFNKDVVEIKIPDGVPVFNISKKKTYRSSCVFLGKKIKPQSIEYANLLLDTNGNHEYHNNQLALQSLFMIGGQEVEDKLVEIFVSDKISFSEWTDPDESEIYKRGYVKSIMGNKYKLYKYILENYSEYIYETMVTCKSQKQTEFIINEFMPFIINTIKKPNIENIRLNFNTDNFLYDIFSQEQVSKLKNILIKTNSVVSGSYPLNYLTGNNFKSGDVDIYVDSNNSDDPICKYIESIAGSTFVRHDSYWYERDRIVCVKNINYNDKTIQIIYLQNGIVPSNYINDNFDFTFCKVIYDGDKISTTVDVVELMQLTGTVTDTMFSESTSLDKKLVALQRSIKYMRRGFTISNLNEFILSIRR